MDCYDCLERGLVMFGFVTANLGELTDGERARYNAVYCGICRNIRTEASNACRLSLSYDMAFLALVLMSLYEPEEASGRRACALHPFRPRPWVENEFTRYAADMNVILAYRKAMDDWEDDRKHSAKAMAGILKKHIDPIAPRYPRQCRAIENCIARLSELERENCPNPDEPANCFGALMGELFVYFDDMWRGDLYNLGFYLGRFVYLCDAATDYADDIKKKKYNPFAAMGVECPAQWEEYLVLAMADCTKYYEHLPLVQDKALMDNILYSGVWGNYRKKIKQQEVDEHDLR